MKLIMLARNPGLYSHRRIVEAAGFRFAGESKVLNNPKDPLDIPVFYKSIRGHTSQFAYKFVKPS